MEDQELYRIEEFTTTGWELADAEYCLLYTSDAADE